MNILAIELALVPEEGPVVIASPPLHTWRRVWRYNLMVNTATMLQDPSGRVLVEPRAVAANVPVDGMGATDSPWDVLVRVCELEGIRLPFISHHAVVVIDHPLGAYAVHNFSPQVP